VEDRGILVMSNKMIYDGRVVRLAVLVVVQELCENDRPMEHRLIGGRGRPENRNPKHVGVLGKLFGQPLPQLIFKHIALGM